MARYVTITRWTPQTARAVNQRYASMVDGSAPQAVLDGWNKMKIVTLNISLNNNFTITVFDVAEADRIAVSMVGYYLQDVCTMESYPVISAEDYAQVWAALPLDQLPKPEPWTK